MAHEAWKDLPPFLQQLNPPNVPWLVYLIAALSVLNFFNSICFAIATGFFRLVFSPKKADEKTKSS